MALIGEQGVVSEGGHSTPRVSILFSDCEVSGGFQEEVSSTQLALGVECSGEARAGPWESLLRDWTSQILQT